MKGVTLLVLVWVISLTEGIGQGIDVIDSLKMELSKVNTASDSFMLLDELVSLEMHINPSEAKKHADQNYKIASELNDDKKLHTALTNLSLSSIFLQDLDGALDYGNQALTLALTLGDTIRICKSKGNLSSIYYYKEDFQQALSLAKEVLKLEELKKDTLGILKALNNLGAMYQNLGKNAVSIDCLTKAAFFAEKKSKKKLLAVIYQNIGVNYATLNAYKKANKYFFKSKEIFDKSGDLYSRITILNSIGENFINLNMDSLAEIYFKNAFALNKRKNPKNLAYTYFGLSQIEVNRNHLHQGLSYAQKAFKYDSIIDYKEKIFTDLVHISDIYGKMKQYKKSYDILTKEMKPYLPYAVPKDIVKQKEYLISTKLGLENNWDLKEDFESYLAAQDSFFSEQKFKIMADLDEKYQATQKEAENALLKKDKELQAEIIQSRNNFLLFSLSGLLFVLGLLGLTYKNYRQKNRSNQLLSEKNEQITTLSHENSHRIKNNLQLLSSMMEMQIRRLDTPELKEAVKESENRVRILSILEKELQMDDFNMQVNLGHYLEKIIQNIRRFYATSDKHFEIEVNIPNINIDADKAMRLGLIINELMTNSIKHAFGNQEEPKISIDVIQKNNIGTILTYKDNGVGIEEDINLDEVKSLGLRLIRNMVKQLHGSWDVQNKSGTLFFLQFPDLLKSA